MPAQSSDREILTYSESLSMEMIASVPKVRSLYSMIFDGAMRRFDELASEWGPEVMMYVKADDLFEWDTYIVRVETTGIRK